MQEVAGWVLPSLLCVKPETIFVRPCYLLALVTHCLRHLDCIYFGRVANLRHEYVQGTALS